MNDTSKQKFPKYLPKPKILSDLPKDGHCVIEASAGTGKTYTIERLFFDLIVNGTEVDKILVVSFTNKATAELRERLAAFIDDALAALTTKPEDEDTKPENKDDYWEIDVTEMGLLETAKRDFYKATISTIDSMTHRMIGESYDLVGIDANAKLLTKGVKAEAFERFMREAVPSDPLLQDMLYVFDKFDSKQSDNLSLDSKKFNAPSTLRKMLESQSKQIFDEIDVNPELTKSGRKLEKVGENLRLYRSCFDQFVLTHKMAPEDVKKKIIEIRKLWTKAVEEKPSNTGPRSIGLEKDDQSFLNLLCNGAENNWLLVPNYFATMREKWGVEEYLTETSQPFENDFAHLYTHAFTLDEMVASYALPFYLKQLESCKNALGIYRHDDYTQALADALGASEGKKLAKRVRERWTIAIVDEFQDTSPAQWEILRRCFIDEGDGRLIVVGDPKQAIYGFRGCDIYTYREAVDTIKKSSKDGTKGVVSLDHNYRSTPEFVERINALFKPDKLFRKDPLNGVFHNNYEDVFAGHGDWVCKDLESGKQLSALGIIEVEFKGKQDDRFEALSKSIVSEIQCLLGEYKGKKFDIVRDSKSGTRDIQKIYILGRTHGSFKQIKPLLIEAGIPFVGGRGHKDSIFNEDEIYELTWIMLAIENPKDHSLIAAALNTTFFGLCLPDIAKIIDDLNSPYFTLFSDWSKKVKKGQFSQLFEEILSESQYRERLTLYGYGDEAYHNVVAVMDYLLAAATKEHLDWTGLCERLGELRREEFEEELASEPETQIVSLMTIHGSKGLEADVVFLLVDKNYGQDSMKTPCYYHRKDKKDEQGNDKLVRVLLPVKQNNIKQAYDGIEQSLEEERLLYVAMTRASLRLYLPFYKEAEESGESQSDENDKNSQLSRLQLACKNLLDDKLLDVGLLSSCEVSDKKDVPPLQPVSDELLKNVIKGIKPRRNELPTSPSEQAMSVYPSPQRMSSFSSLKGDSERNVNLDFSKIWQTSSLDHAAERISSLPGGATTGNFLHKLLEEVDFSFVQEQHKLNCSADNWLSDLSVPGVKKAKLLFEKTADAYDFVGAALEKAKELVFSALTKKMEPFAPNGLCGVTAATSEMEFLCSKKWKSTPSTVWPNMATDSDYLKGFIDLLYWQGDKLYALDWKSNTLDGYSLEAIKEHVSEHYQGQVDIYTFAVRRFLHALGKPDSAYGGMVYVYLRGVEANSENGFYFIPAAPPKSADLCAN